MEKPFRFLFQPDKQLHETTGKRPVTYREEYVYVVGGFIEDTFIGEKGKYETIERRLEQNQRQSRENQPLKVPGKIAWLLRKWQTDIFSGELWIFIYTLFGKLLHIKGGFLGNTVMKIK